MASATGKLVFGTVEGLDGQDDVTIGRIQRDGRVFALDIELGKRHHDVLHPDFGQVEGEPRVEFQKRRISDPCL